MSFYECQFCLDISHIACRGFVVKRHETHQVTVSEAGQHQVPGEQKASSPEQKPCTEDTSPGVGLTFVSVLLSSALQSRSSIALSAGIQRSKQ